MAPGDVSESILTARLELVPLSAPFVDALADQDPALAGQVIDAAVSRWFARESAHVVQLELAQAAGEPTLPPGSGRVVVMVDRAGTRRAIGFVGFHGPPDERGRLEVGCRISPAYRGRGYAGEAMRAMFAWAAARLGVTRFLVSVSPEADLGPRPLSEVELGRGEFPSTPTRRA